jgi:hypothetical protein
MHESLPPPLAQWVALKAEAMGLPGPDDYILLLIKLAKQEHDLQGTGDRYRRVFTAASPQPVHPGD